MYSGKVSLISIPTRNSLSMTNRAMRLCKFNGVADLQAFPYVLPRPIWSLFFLEYSHRQRRTPKLGRVGTPPLWNGGVADPVKLAPSHMCYHVKFGSSVSKDVRINIREPPKLGPTPLRWVWLSPRNTPLPMCVTLLNLVVRGETVRALFSRSAWKIWSLTSHSF